MDPSSVRACCRGRQKRTGEYEFKLAPLAEDQHDKPGEVWWDVQLQSGKAGVVSAPPQRDPQLPAIGVINR